MSALALDLEVSPRAWSAGALEEVELTLTLTNRGLLGVTLYPNETLLSVMAGWPGPFWDLELSRGGSDLSSRFRELRTWYGPPGMPPTRESFSPLALKRGAAHVTPWRVCWIPAAQLRPENLSLAALDPEGMDGLAPLELERSTAGVLTFRSLAEVVKDREARADFLRPGRALFFPERGEYALQFGFRGDGHQARSNPVAVTIS